MLHPSLAEADEVIRYRPFIDGLRAISILSVVAYHLGLRGVPGGFVGVDVFFVISGFLIINQIIIGLERRSFSFAEFWMRRVLRILPPYFLVLAASFAIAALVLVTPGEFAEFGREARDSALMVVNYYFLSKQGYFDGVADTKPLLHLWTLAVEEQFYLVVPILLFALWWVMRRSGARLAPLIGLAAAVAVTLASFVFCVAHTAPERNAAFFLMPYRAWEFTLGGMIPLLIPLCRRLPPVAGGIAAAIGVALVLGSVAMLDGGMPFPSWRALIPVAGACLLILGCLVQPANPVAAVLSWRPMVWIGLVSYAWYLWHWPLLTFTRIYDFGDRDLTADSVAVAVSLALAAATHHWLEVPVRRWRQARRFSSWRSWRVILAGLAGAAAFYVLGFLTADVLAPAVERRIPPQMWTTIDRKVTEKDVCAISRRDKTLEKCLAGAKGRPIGLLIGNSHARMVYLAVRNAAEKQGAELVTLWASGCKPYVAVEGFSFRRTKDCAKWFARGMATLVNTFAHVRPDYAVFSVNWTSEPLPRPERREEVKAQLSKLGITEEPPETFLEELGVGLAATIARLNELGTGRILIVGPAPGLRKFAPPCLLRADRRGIDREVCAAKRAWNEAERDLAMTTLRFVTKQFPNVRLADPIDVFCDAKLCRPYDGDVLLYDDDHHINDYGAERLVSGLAKDFAWAFTGKEDDAPEPAKP